MAQFVYFSTLFRQNYTKDNVRFFSYYIAFLKSSTNNNIKVLKMVAAKTSITAQVDEALSLGRFGNDKSLAYNIRTLYAGIQKILSTSIDIDVTSEMFSSSAAAQVVIRATLDEAFVLLENNNLEGARQKVNDLKQNFTSLAVDSISSETYIFPEQDLQPLSSLSSNEFFKRIVYRLKDSLVKDGFTDEVEFIEPTKSHHKAIENGKTVLKQLTPRVSSSTLSLVRCLVLVNAAIGSAYFNETPFMYIVGLTRLDDPLQTADTILHEALHQKMADISLTRQILSENYDDLESKASKDLLIPWGASSPRPFSVALGLAAYHFYLHSTLVHAAALEHLPTNTVLQSIGSEEITSRLILAFDRATYLETSLRGEVARKKMGSDGISFVAWMSNALEQLRKVRLLDGTKLEEQQLKFSDNRA